MTRTEEIYGEENVTHFVAELERVEQTLAPDPKAIDEASKLTRKWDLHPFEQRLLAIELDFFQIRPQAYGRTGPSYSYRYEQAGDHLVFQGGEGFVEAGWHLRMGANMEKVQQAIRPGFFNHAESMLEAVTDNIHGLVFNVAHEEVLKTFGYCARQALQARKQS